MNFKSLLKKFFVCLACVSALFAANTVLGKPGSQLLPLSLAATNTGTISLPGQQDSFTFSGTTGQRLYYDAFDLDFENLSTRLISPSGATVWDINHSSDFGPFYLLESGNYTLVIDGNGETTGDYSFRMLDMSSAISLTYGLTVTNSLNPQSQTLVYQFTGTNGQRLGATNFAVSSTEANWRLVSPAGQNLFNDNIAGSPGEVVLRATGTYLLLFEGYTENIGTLSFQSRLSLVSNPSGATVGFGTLRSGNTVAEQTNNFAYTAPAGLVVYLDSQTNDSPVSVYLIDPTGALIFGVSGNSDSGPHVLPRSGNYTLRVYGNDTGDYRLVLLNLSGSGATTLTSGTTYTQTLNPGFKNEIYRFNSAVGQSFYYDALDSDFDSVSALLFDANGGNAHISGNADSDAGPFMLTQPGTNYLVLRSDAADNTMNFSFRLIDGAQSPAVALALDTTINVVNNPGTGASVYRFTGTNGQRLFFNFASTNDSAGNWTLYGPQNQGLIGSSPNGDAEITLPGTGPYLLTVGNNSQAGTARYSFRVVTPDITTNVLTLGTVISGSLLEAGEEDRFTFTGLAGQRLYYDALNSDFDSIGVSIINPSGGVVFINGNSDSDVGPFTLTEPGTYTLLQKGSGDSTGDYSFQLIDIAQSPTRILTLDTTILGTNGPNSAVTVFRLTGNAGQRLYFDAMPTNGAGSWTLYGPENQGLSGNGLNSDFEVTLPQNGTYVVVAGNSGTPAVVPFSFRVVTPNTTTNVLTFGAPVTGSLVEAGEEDRFTFTGSFGQRLYYDALDNDFDSISVQLINPSGAVVLINGNSDSDVGPFTLTQAGTYTLLQKASGDFTGDYSFRLIDIAQSPTRILTLDTTINGTNNPGLSATIFRLSGSAGQRLYFDAMPTNSEGSWSLYGPENQGLNGNSLTADFEATLPQTGTYVVVAGNSGVPDLVAFSLRVVTPNTTTNLLTLGATVAGTLVEAGEEDRFTFAGSIGQRLYYDALDADFDAINVQLLNPNGGVVSINGNSDSDVGPFTLTEAGTYTLLQKASGIFTNDYRFRLIDLAVSPAITYDVNVTNQLNPQIGAQLYRIEGVAGQRIGITNLAASSGNASWSLFGPVNNGLLAVNIQDDLGEITLLVTGTYALVVAGNQDFIGGLDYQFRVSLISSGNGGTSGFGTVQSDNTVADQTNSYNYTAPAGLPVYFDALTDASPVTIQFMAPGGNPVFTIGGGSDAGPFFLPESGNYTLNVIGTGSGAFNFRLLDMTADSTSLSFGTTCTQILSPAFRTDIYRFTGSFGQRLYYDALENDNDNVVARLFRPDGANVFIGGNSDSEFGLFTLTQSGDYYLAIVSQLADDTVDYSFRLIDAAQTPAQDLTLDTSVESTLDPGTIVDIYRVVGSAGQRIYFDGASTNISPGYWQLFGTENQHLGGNWLFADFEVILPSNGTNLLVLFKNDGNATTNPLPYSFRAVTPDRTTNALTLGATVTGTLNEAGEEDRFTFTGTAGQRLYYDALENDGDSLSVQLINPSGSIVFINGNPDSDVGPFTLIESGTYTLLQKASTEVTGDYNFRLIDVAQAPAQNLALDTPVDATLALGTSVDIYRVVGSAGQRIYFDGASTNISPGYWQLYGTENQGLGGNWVFGDFEITLPTSGTNLLIVFRNDGGNDPTPLPYFMRLVTPDRTTNALTLGVTVMGTLNEPGEDDRFTFTGTSGQRLYYDALDNDFDSLSVQLINPSGSIVSINGNSDSDIGPFTLIESGTYTLLQRAFSDVTGDYSFRLIDISQLPAVTVAFDTVVNGTNNPGTAATIYRFDSIAGRRLYFDANPTNSGGSWNLYGPQNQGLNGTSLGGDFEIPSTQSGTHVLVVVNNDTNSASYNFQIIPGNHAPILGAIGNLSVNEQSNLTFTATATDLEAPNDQLTFSLDTGAPATATINPTTGVFSWTPTEVQGPGVYPVTIRVTDDGIPVFDDFETFNITVNEVNLAPVLTVPANTNINELTTLTVTNTATDADVPANSRTFSLVSVSPTPSGAVNLNATTGVLTFTPSEADGAGTNVFTIRVTDHNPVAINTTNLTDTKVFTVIVNEVNLAPVLTVPANTNINELTTLTVTNTATDADVPANARTFSLVSVSPTPSGAVNLNATTGVLTFTPSEADGAGTNVFTIRVTDHNPVAVNTTNLTDTKVFTVIVNEVNVAPVLTVPANTNINELTTLTVTNTATDADIPANARTFSLVSVSPTPSGAVNLNATSGVLTFTPSEADGVRTNVFTIRVTDHNPDAVNTTNLTDTKSFTVIVNEVNLAPVLTVPANTNINELATLTVTNTATDADAPANSRTFSLVSVSPTPSGAVNLNATSGVLTFTPSEADGAGTNVFTIRVTDHNPVAVNTTNLTDTKVFTVIVNEVNLAPVLAAISNRTINVGVVLTISNSVTDADVPANGFTFGLLTAPSGAGIHPTSGVFTWRPGVTRAGTSNNVEVIVTDSGTPPGTNSKTFAIIVNPLAPVTLVPVSYTNGLFQLQVSGDVGPDYTIQRSGNLTNWISLILTNPAITPFTISDTNANNSTNQFYRVLLGP